MRRRESNEVQPSRRSFLAAGEEEEGARGRATAPPRAAPHASAWWGPLASQQLFVVSFGPPGAPCSGIGDTGRSATSVEAEADGHSPSADTRQEELLNLLHMHGGSLLSSLPPSAWMLLAPEAAAEAMRLTPGVCVVSA